MPTKLRRPSEQPACATFGRISRSCIAGVVALALAGCVSSSQFDYAHLPAGYHWRAVYDAPTNALVFYGRDPLSHDTVYVGPDNRFYTFRHSGTIQVKDLSHRWTPHDAL
ncbi:MAG: hypothetical protein JO263_00665 [Candidatus Eremiobacteraeota bacterium]|nr:hypothetical protein [Candidatus Eremiobacteraeota bacterium]